MVGPYRLLAPLASGGFGQVFVGKRDGPHGFSRVVALKSLVASRSDDVEASAMMVDEARIASRVKHPNVVPLLDVVQDGPRLWLVMEYVPGESLARLLARGAGTAVPLPVVLAVVCGVLRGLHAAHEATDTEGKPLGIVHRDVTPHNVMISEHGVPRVLDFGIAKAAGRLSVTRHGQVKGKLAYMAPEQLADLPVDRRTDLYAAAVVTCELCRGLRTSEAEAGGSWDPARGPRLLEPLAELLPEALRDVLARALSPDPSQRHDTASDMADALEGAGVRIASEREVAAWLISLVGEELFERRARLERADAAPSVPRLPGAESAPDGTVSALAIGSPSEPATGAGATPTDAAPAPNRSRLPAALLIGAAAGALLWWRWPSERATAPDVVATTSAPLVADSASASPTGRAQTLAPSAPSEPTPTEPRSSLPRASATLPRATTAPRSSTDPRPKSRECEIPYRLDERGVKVLKIECLK